MMDGLLLQTIEGLGDPSLAPLPCDIWESLETAKECVTREISSAGSLCLSERDGMQESEASEGYLLEVEWHRRGRLEARLRDLCEAKNRLMYGVYGRCEACDAIDRRRLAAYPAAAFDLSKEHRLRSSFTPSR